jgi:hypothetical protein
MELDQKKKKKRKQSGSEGETKGKTKQHAVTSPQGPKVRKQSHEAVCDAAVNEVKRSKKKQRNRET